MNRTLTYAPPRARTGRLVSAAATAVFLQAASTSHALPYQFAAVSASSPEFQYDPVLGKRLGLNEPLRFAGTDAAHNLGYYKRVPLTAGESLVASCMADVNADGNDDVVAVLREDGTGVGMRQMATFFGGPTGFTAGPRAPFSIATYTTYENISLKAADVDRDGDKDILLLYGWGNAHQELTLFYNYARNTGSFDVGLGIVNGSSGNMCLTDVVVMDANLDIWPDLVVADSKNDKVVPYLNNGGTTFTASATPIAEDHPARLWVYDMDRDGKEDLVTASGEIGEPAPRRLTWRRFEGFGFASPVVLDTQTENLTQYDGMCMGDVNDDGADDLVFARTLRTYNPNDSYYHTSRIWYRTGSKAAPGTFGTVTQMPGLTVNNQEIHGLGSGDFDNDGDIDLWGIRGYTGWAHELLFENLRVHGDSGPVVADMGGTNPTGAASLTTADVDGDSWTDLIASSAGSKAILWYGGKPAGGFEAPVSISTGTAVPACVCAGDLDEDNRTDLAWAVPATGEIRRAWNNNGAGTVWSQGTVATLPGLTHLSMGNAGSDHDLDLLAVSSGGTITWYNNNNGAGSGWTQDVLPALSNARQAAIMRLNSNVRMQVSAVSAAVGGTAGALNVRNFFLYGSPPWQLLYGESSGTENASAAVTCGDFNHDGSPDVAWCAGSDEIFWRNPTLTVTETESVGTAPGSVRSVRTVDWNDDGKSDILCAHSAGVTVWLSRSAASWTELTLHSGGNCTDAIGVDIDHDGQTDVAAFDATAGKIKLITHAAAPHVSMTDEAINKYQPLRMDASQSAYVLRLDAKYLGLSGSGAIAERMGGWHEDAAAIPERIRLRFAEVNEQNQPGAALTTAKLGASVDKVLIVKESSTASNPVLDPNDTVLAEVPATLSSGYLTATMPTTASLYEDFSAGHNSTRLYVALKMKAAVSSAATGRFFVQHVVSPVLLGTRFVTAEGLPERMMLNTAGTTTDGQRVRITTPYEQWRKIYFGTYDAQGEAWHNSDPDKDGMDNLTEYVLQTHPKQINGSPASMSLAKSFGSYMLLVDLPVTMREDGIVTIQQSTDLDNWTSFAQRTGNGAWTGAPGSVFPFTPEQTRSIFQAPAGARQMLRLTYSVVP